MLKNIYWLPLVLLTACADPIVMIPGGKLKGEVTAVPATWVSVPEVVQLETRPADPYSVNIWALTANGNLYFATDKAKWLEYITEDNRVRLRADNAIYELKAIQVTDETEIASLVAAYKRKYDYDVDGSMGDAFRLTEH
ncbi:MAG: hypothetical protein HOC70_12955 [Gammaproteobacteria bacterium]|jgi:hypothetical protein|nr:hypothetical protein [Gammaproteobacteria bacterium]MBT4494143.1 hypothetical protein [Gammaproteobacteria bacterium]MBT7372184.1 hypothetical protein [Gammaproteobacteria bacterium]